MEHSIRNFLRQFSHYATGGILTFLGGIVSFPILTRVLSTRDYGLMSLISVTLWIILALSKGGLQESAVRFYAEYNSSADAAAKRTYYATLFWGSLALAVALALLVIIIGYLYAWLMPDQTMAEFTLILAGLVLSGTMSMRMLNFLRAEQKTKLYNSLVVVVRYLSLALSLGFLLLWSSTLKIYYAGVVLAESAVTLAMIYILVRRVSLAPSAFSSPMFKSMLLFGIPLIGYELAYFLMKSIDRYIIQFFLGAESVGIYSVASNMCNYLKDLILFPIMYTITPMYVEMWERQGREATSRFISRITTISILIVLPVLFGFLNMGQEVIILIASEKYLVSAALLPYIVPATILWGLSPLFAAGMYIDKNTKKMTLFAALAVLINIAANLLLVPHLALTGSAIATLISYVFLYVLLAVHSMKTITIRPDGRLVVASLAASLIMFGVLHLFPKVPTTVYFFTKMTVGAAVYGLSVLLLSAEIRKSLFALVGRHSSLETLPQKAGASHEIPES